MRLALLALAGALLTGGPRRVEAPPRPELPPGAPVDLVVVFDERDGRRLWGEQKAPAHATPPLSGYRLLERAPGGDRTLADGVGAAAFAPDGAVLFVRGGELVELGADGPRVLASGVRPDFAVAPAGDRLAVVRKAASGTSLDLLDRQGRLLRTLVPARGWNGMPVFSPEGQTLVFVSSRTGVASLFSVGADGRGLRQLTNVGLSQPVGPRFVPPPEARQGLGFSAPGRLDFQGSRGQRFRLDLATRRVEGVP